MSEETQAEKDDNQANSETVLRRVFLSAHDGDKIVVIALSVLLLFLFIVVWILDMGETYKVVFSSAAIALIFSGIVRSSGHFKTEAKSMGISLGGGVAIFAACFYLIGQSSIKDLEREIEMHKDRIGSLQTQAQAPIQIGLGARSAPYVEMWAHADTGEVHTLYTGGEDTAELHTGPFLDRVDLRKEFSDNRWQDLMIEIMVPGLISSGLHQTRSNNSGAFINHIDPSAITVQYQPTVHREDEPVFTHHVISMWFPNHEDICQEFASIN